MNYILHCFIRGEVFIAGTVGILATIGYVLVGLPLCPDSWFSGRAAGIHPLFRPMAGAVPALLIGWLAGSHKFLWTLVVILLIQQLENVFITPKYWAGGESASGIHYSVLMDRRLFSSGVAGMFLAVPAVLILRVIIRHIYLSIVAVK